MEKRWLLFLYLAFMAFLLNSTLPQLLWGPPQQVAQPDEQEKAAEKDGKVVQKGLGNGEENPAKLPPLVEGQPPEPVEEDVADQPAAQPAAGGAAAGAPAAKPKTEPQQQWLTLGSLDRTTANPYRMLVTFTNRGAAVRRLELADPKYRDIEDHSGYLGHLQTIPTPANDGLLVQVVGSGTPAAEADVRPGDVIESIDDDEVATPDDLFRVLQKRKPRDNVSVNVRRNGRALSLPATLARYPLSLLRPEQDNLRLRRVDPPAGFEDPPSFELTLAQLGKTKRAEGGAEIAGAELREVNWDIVEQTETSVTFRRSLASGIDVIKRYSLEKIPQEARADKDYRAYHLTLDVELRNTGAEKREIAYQLDGPTGLPIEGWWYTTRIGRTNPPGERDIVGQWLDQSPVSFPNSVVAKDEDDSLTVDHSLAYLGVDAQYFAVVLMPMKESMQDVWFSRTEAIRVGPEPGEDDDLTLVNVTCRMVSQRQTLAPDATFKHNFTIFAGPKKPEIVEQYYQPSDPSYSLSALVYYGLWIWAVVAKAMLAVLHFFYGIVGNYGIAIILLTVLVRACMFPLSRKQAMNMIKMQELQPEMKRIQEKYKKDMEKRTKAMQDLFRKHNHNPMGGCLLMLIQLPIFLGLYRALMIDVELRGAPLFSENIRWCSNLGAPDMLFDWSGFMPPFIVNFLGPYFNLLPLITVGLFLVQQKMFMPPPADEQAAMQQKIMKYMMIVIGVMFYVVASGLCIYFIASTLWGMAERKFLPKFQGAKPDGADALVIPATEPPRSSNGSEGNPRKKQKRR